MNHIVDDLKNHEFELWEFDEDDIQVQNIVMTYDYGHTLHLHNLVLLFERLSRIFSELQSLSDFLIRQVCYHTTKPKKQFAVRSVSSIFRSR